MQRGSWAFLAMFVLVLACLFVWFFSDGEQDQAWANVQQVKTYPVPPERGEAIRDALRTVMLSNRDEAQPLGQASLPVPNMLVVAAPATMQPSIKTAIAELSHGVSAESKTERSVAFDLLVVEVSKDIEAMDDPALTPVQGVVAQARREFGLGPLRLVGRTMVVASRGRGNVAAPSASVKTGVMDGRIRVNAIGEHHVDAGLELYLLRGASGMRQDSGFVTSFSLPNDQWQVIGLLGGSGDAPDRLLLMRQRTASPES